MRRRCRSDGGRDGNIVTGGAAFAHIDLVLHLLRTRFKPSLADAVSRAMVIDGRQSQAQYIVPTTLANGNELATKLVACFEAGLPNPPSVAALATEFYMSSRTLSRRIKESTGRSVSRCSRACASIARACFWRPARCPSSRWPSRLAMPIPPRCGALCGRLRKRHQDSSGRWCLTVGAVPRSGSATGEVAPPWAFRMSHRRQPIGPNNDFSGDHLATVNVALGQHEPEPSPLPPWVIFGPPCSPGRCPLLLRHQALAGATVEQWQTLRNRSSGSFWRAWVLSGDRTTAAWRGCRRAKN